jgi:peptidoglycan/xylan/chitin deacetylase (PgdA/CDA1 family)
MSAAADNGSSYRPDSRRLTLAAFFGLFVLLTATLILLSGPPSVGASGTDLRKATVTQKGRVLLVQIKSGDRFALSRLVRQPQVKRPASHYLCIEMRRRNAVRASRICIGGRSDSRRKAGFARVTPKGEALKPGIIPVKVKGSATAGLTVSFIPGRAGLTPGNYSWRITYSNGACLDRPNRCRSSYPREGSSTYRVRPVQVVGCTGGNGEVVKSGPRGRKLVALTFDDGPSSYTPDVLRILKEKKAKATFFMLGSQVAADPSAARRVLAEGHEIGNHSSTHPMLPSYGNIAGASRTIRQVTGFKPCLFRPPYGAINSSVKRSAKDLGMKSVIWDVDTSDWTTPGTGAIRSRVSSARSGSIVLMHDGGGPRSQTVDALSGAIHNLRSRGYSFVTVTKLLGNRFIYRPR